MLADILTKEELYRTFPTSKTVVGPVVQIGAHIFGRDVAYPLSPFVIAAALHIFKAYVEGVYFQLCLEMWSMVPTLAVKIPSAGDTLPVYVYAEYAAFSTMLGLPCHNL